MTVSDREPARHAAARPLTAFAIAVLTFVLYVPAIGTDPVYLHHDEVFFGLNAHSIATTGRDINGRFMPLYFEGVTEHYWYHPVDIYSMAIAVKVFGLSEWALRLPGVIAAVIDVVLLYAIAVRVFRRESVAVVAAALMMLTPAHFIHSRLAMDYIYTLPFLLGWLACLLKYRDEPSPRTLFLATMCLGFGFFSYIASVVMMPLYLVMTIALLLYDRRKLSDIAVAVAGFGLPLLLLVAWLLKYPQTLASATTKYTPGIAGGGVLRGLRDALHFYNITDRVTLYWAFQNPSYLFLTGGSNPTNSTRFIGVFTLAVSVLFIVGLIDVIRRPRPPIRPLVLAGFLTAPLAALGMLEPYAIDRELGVIPFGVLIAVIGVTVLWESRHRFGRGLAIVLIACVPLQFAVFQRDYYGDYKVRSSEWFERNTRGAIEAAIAHASGRTVPAVYLTRTSPRIDYYWTLYLEKHHREDLLPTTVYFAEPEKFEARGLPAGAIVISDAHFAPEEARFASLINSGELKLLTVVSEPSGSPSFRVLER